MRISGYCASAQVYINYFVEVGETPRQLYNVESFQKSVNMSTSLVEMISKYVVFLNCLKIDTNGDIYKYVRQWLLSSLDDLRIQYEIIEDEDGEFIFPKGVPEMDDALVSQPLRWLNGYPKAERAWGKALRNYAEAADENASDVADLFRKALEAFFMDFFATDKSLENCISEYGTYLKSRGIPKEISNDFQKLLKGYTDFMNEFAKHRDATSDAVLEYLMYQTGNIMRLLLTLKQKETT